MSADHKTKNSESRVNRARSRRSQLRQLQKAYERAVKLHRLEYSSINNHYREELARRLAGEEELKRTKEHFGLRPWQKVEDVK